MTMTSFNFFLFLYIEYSGILTEAYDIEEFHSEGGIRENIMCHDM